MAETRTVAVLAGGRSPEHDISRASGREVLAALDPARWRGMPVYLARDGSWRVGEAGASAESAFSEEGPGDRVRAGQAVAGLAERGVAAVFPALHGRFGEDGCVQGLLELHDLPYVGSGVAASAVGMDKIRTRDALCIRGMPMAKAVVFDEPLVGTDPDAVAERVVAEIGFPCFLKTDLSGSTLGVRKVEDVDGVRAFVREEWSRGVRFLAEQLVVGEEISVPVLGNSMDAELRPLTPIGIYPRAGEGFFSHAAKYEEGGSEEVAPPRGFDSEATLQVQELAVRCHRALWCDGLSRTDMIVSPEYGPVILEVNTLPGLSPASLLPKAAAADGLSFPQLLDELIQHAMRRVGGRG